MRHSTKNRTIVACMTAAVLGYASQGVAAQSPFDITFDPGLACSFALRIQGAGDGNIADRLVQDKNGVTKIISAGTGGSLIYTNVTTGKTFSTKSNGAVQQATYSSDGSSSNVLTGHNVVIMYPTDVPAGPSTTLYQGRVTYTVDTAGVWTVESVSGKTTDICAAVSG